MNTNRFVRRKKKPTLVVSAGAQVVLDGLPSSERALVDAALVSADAILKLDVTAQVNGPDGPLYAARVTPRLRLIYSRDDSQVLVTDLMNAKLLAHLPAPARPRKPPKRTARATTHTNRQ